MKIVMATHYFGSHNGGVEIIAEHLFRQFSSKGHQVLWIAGDADACVESRGTQTRRTIPNS